MVEESIKDCQISILTPNGLKKFDNIKFKRVVKSIKPFSNCLFLTTDKSIQKLLDNLKIIANNDENILITGESGTGKDLLAELIHKNSIYSHAPLNTLNITSINHDLIESELFGHTKGSFTGASQNRLGLARASQGGTLFLDEIGDFPLNLQPKLLRLLDKREIKPVGSDTIHKLNVRIISATNKNIFDMVQNRLFRLDLYYRLNFLRIHIPPLRERTSDIYYIAKLYALCFGLKLEQKALELLTTFKFSGNIRELRTILKRAYILYKKQIITEDMIHNLCQKNWWYSSKVNQLM